MTVCPSCATELPEGSRFCLSCGARLAAPAAAAEERKTVTTLFCDLVAFTAMSEAADPEDVDALLRTYHAAARKVIESHGGAVEKFIGDAVVGVFGVPAAHEDDPERAARAGLRIVQALEGMTRPDGSPLEVRVGVNTGEALVRLDVTPGSGEGFLTGDAVNVAARLQAAAPPGGVVVGEATHSLSARAIVYEELPPVTAKGKAEPVSAWLALEPAARMGVDIADARETPMVGRDHELAFVRSLFHRCVDASLPQLALIVGEPGIGKSRLVAELLAYVNGLPGMTTWRQGHCLPYGEGVTYWPFAEIVRAHAGILDSDDRDTLRDKLEAVLPDDADRPWYRNRLRALLGEPAPDASRAENFVAWSRFVEHVAAQRPLVLVFEDLHWADDALLAFIESLAEEVSGVPLLIVCAARPELLDAHEAFAAAPRCASRIDLTALRELDMAHLVLDLLDGAVAPAEVQAAIVQRSAGNPYFAGESARLLTDSGMLARRGGPLEPAVDGGAAGAGAGASARPETLPLPDSVQALIAARLDALSPSSKALLADASVIGPTFWGGAVEALGRRETAAADEALRELAAKQFVRRSRTSTMEGEREYTFWHALAREVAYQQLPRASRARKHVAAARWIEAKVGERSDEMPEILAHHYTMALEYARSCGQADLAAELLDPTLGRLLAAGVRTLKLDPPAAERYYRTALGLAPVDHRLRPRILLGFVELHQVAFRFKEAEAAAVEVIPLLERVGDDEGAAQALCRLVACRWYSGGDTEGLLARAQGLLDRVPPTEAHVRTLASFAGWSYLAFDGRVEETLEHCARAVALAARLDLPVPVDALSLHALARLENGDAQALSDYDRALAEAERQGLKTDVAMLKLNRGGPILALAGAAEAYSACLEGLEYARASGVPYFVVPFEGAVAQMLSVLGDWDEALSRMADVAAAMEEGDDVWDLLDVRSRQVQVMARRGTAESAEPLVRWLLEKRLQTPVSYLSTFALCASATVYRHLGRISEALDLLREWTRQTSMMGDVGWLVLAPGAVRVALAGGEASLAEIICSRVCPGLPLGEHVLVVAGAARAEARGEHEAAAVGFADAAARWRDFSVPYEEGHALLGQGRCLAALGRAPEAAAPLTAAREVFARLGARPALAETDDLRARLSAPPPAHAESSTKPSEASIRQGEATR